MDTVLVIAKSRVAPLQTRTIPKLELEGTRVLVQMMKMVGAELKIPGEQTYAWSDSTIVLGWFSSNVTRLKVYVAHRVAEIIDIIPASKWRYVPTQEYPADLVSRGVYPKELAGISLWWKGPPWLSQPPSYWPLQVQISRNRDLPELKSTVLTVQTPAVEYGVDVSDLNRLIRRTAWTMRFIYNCRSREKNKDPTLSYQETEAAKKFLIRLSQEHHFGQEMKRVQKGLEMTKSSPLAAYRPLLKDGLLRVGGRLQKTGMQANHIHPLLLSRRAHFSKLIATGFSLEKILRVVLDLIRCAT